jgi:hypothetical protein
MKRNLLNRGERGSALILISFVVMIISVLGAVFSMTTLNTHKITRSYQNSDQALAAALAGSEYALYKLSHIQEPEDVNFAETISLPYGDPNSTADDIVIRVNSRRAGTYGLGDDLVTVAVVIEADATVHGITRGVRSTVHNHSQEVHELYYKAIFAGNSCGVPYTMEFTGKSNDADKIRGDAHNNGDIEFSLNAFATWNWGNNKCTATGSVHRVDNIGNINLVKGGGDKGIIPPNLQAQGYDSMARRYREWDGNFQGGERNVVSVNDAYAHYGPSGTDEIIDIKMSQEGGWFDAGNYPEWNTQCQNLPDDALANFFQFGYQNHYADTFEPGDDTQIGATTNFYLGQRNGGTSSSYGDRFGLYGGGHSVITITPEQNNKIYYIDGNLWVDSDGSNHVFFVPGEGVDKVNITIVVKGNIYIGDQIWTCKYDKNQNIGGSTNAECFQMLDEDTGVALIAMADGESYDDANRDGKYGVGESILGRPADNTPAAAGNNPSAAGMYATNYQGRMEGSGNIVFGDTISGPVGVVEAFLYAENNFQDITSCGSDQKPFTFGNMSAGNHVYLKRNYEEWQQLQAMPNPPTGWVEIDGAYYPPGTTAATASNPFITERKWEDGKLYCRRHNPLLVTFDERIRDGSVDLPGLPSSLGLASGVWVPLAMTIHDGAVLPADWTGN